MIQYKIVNRGAFNKESTFEKKINEEARNGWRVISVGYDTGGTISKAVLEKNSN